MEHEIRVGRREATLVVSRRRPVRLAEVGGVIGAAFGEVYGYLGSHGGTPVGPPFVIYHGSPATDDPFDMEVCAPVARPIDPPAGWAMQELPAGTFATLLHVGPYDTVGDAYETLFAWLGSHRMEAAGPPREVYLSEPGTPPDRIRTIVELPVAEAAMAVPAG